MVAPILVPGLRPNSIPDFSAHFVHFVHKMCKQTRTKQLYTRFFSHFEATKKNRTKNTSFCSLPTCGREFFFGFCHRVALSSFVCTFCARLVGKRRDGRPLSHVFGYRTCRNAQRVKIGYRVRFFSHTLCIFLVRKCTTCRNAQRVKIGYRVRPKRLPPLRTLLLHRLSLFVRLCCLSRVGSLFG